jgi:uncharacterized protein YprB with RNaseH-like and TPR domain
MSSALGERLRRLRRPGSPPPLASGGSELSGATDEPPAPSDALARLEARLLGGIEDGLTLKERLERLVAVAARRPRGGPALVPGPPLEELIHGRRVENARGEFFLVEDDVHLETLHGAVPLTRLRALDPAAVSILTGQPALEAFDLRRAVFLDTETTGLAGGTGTAAFLVGVGWVEGERFRFRQYFMRDYHEEAALLRGLAEDLSGVERIVTFNGGLFDVPLLESRYRLNRERFPLGQALHFDLLHPARRLWKARLESCRLQSLERALLGVARRGDVPGEEIPRIYFDFVRRRDGRAMARVLEHNRLDVLSLAALAALACQWVEGGYAEDPRDVYCLARVLERAALHERSEEQYRRLLAEPPGFLRTASLLRLAARAKRAGQMDTAVAYWQEAARSGDWLALRELALHHEHRSRDLPAALSAVEDGLGRLDGEQGPGTRRALEDFHRRRHRLMAKLGRRRRPPSA